MVVNNSVFPIDNYGMWREVCIPPGSLGRRAALFLDRDGTLIELVNYIEKAEDVKPIPDAVSLIVNARSHNMAIILVTNQSGIGRGYFDWGAFASVQNAVNSAVALAGGEIDAIYACPALPESNAMCRKPNPGMLLAGASDLDIDLSCSWIIGDTASDMIAGARAGIPNGWLVDTGYGLQDREKALQITDNNFQVTVGRPLADLGNLIMTN